MAIDSIKKNKRLYLPFMLSSAGIVSVYYIMMSLSLNETLQSAYAGMYVSLFLDMGRFIIITFSIIFLFYSSSFVNKRRKSELGLYNILGLEKKHIINISFVEYLLCYVISLIIGLIAGVIFEKALFLIILGMLDMDVSFGSIISFKSIVSSIEIYGLIYFSLFLYGVYTITKSNPLELLKEKNSGEKEPKAKWLLTIIGIVTMGLGYFIALNTKTAMETVLTFFPAVFLVIIGTYLIFTTGSIALLKALKKNKRYYYKTNHFITISNMMFRMKKNAVGLASICILSTMVLVMISSTTSLWFSLDRLVEESYPMDMIIKTSPYDNKEQLLEELNNISDKNNTSFFDIKSYVRLETSSTLEDDKIYFSNDYNDPNLLRKQVIMQFVALDDFNNFTDDHQTLKEDEILLYNINNNNYQNNHLKIYDKDYKIKQIYNQKIDKLPLSNNINSNQFVIVVPTLEDVEEIYEYQKTIYGDYASDIKRITLFDVAEGTNTYEIKNDIYYKFEDLGLDKIRVDVQDEIVNDFRGLYGAFLFLGIFLGIVFMIAIVLIVYYKQISEGSEDAKRFEIMKKVGLSNDEIKKAINSQVLIVFFAPLVIAIIHLFGSYNLVYLVIQLLSANSTDGYILTFMLSIIVFVIFYIIVYIVTSKAYYKIVSKSN